MDVLNARWVLMGGESIARISTCQVEIVEIGRIGSRAAPEPFVLGLTKQVRYKSCGTWSWPTPCGTGSPAGVRGALPSEAELGREYGVSRVTVRRALELLRDEGLVTGPPGRRLVRRRRPGPPVARAGHHGRGRARGRRRATPSRRVLEFAFEPAPPDVAKTLGPAGRRRGAAGHPAEPRRRRAVRGRHGVGRRERSARTLSRADVERSTFYDLLPLQGVEPGRVVQTITAVAADRPTARRLGVPDRRAAAGLSEGHLRSPRRRGHRRRAPLRGPPHRARSRIPLPRRPREPVMAETVEPFTPISLVARGVRALSRSASRSSGSGSAGR